MQTGPNQSGRCRIRTRVDGSEAHQDIQTTLTARYHWGRTSSFKSSEGGGVTMGAWPNSPCLEKNCSFCCRKTEMPLSPSDVLRLATTTGQHPDQFSKEESGIRILLNNPATEACVFLDTESNDPQAPGLCSIYENRPIGCRTYPLILNADDEAFLDTLCPHRDDFPEVPPALLMMLKRLDSELQGQS